MRSRGGSDLRGDFFQHGRINARAEADFRFAGFGENFQLFVTPAFVVPFQNHADGINDSILLRAFIRLSGFDGDHVIALILFLKKNRLQWQIVENVAHNAVGLCPKKADCAAMPFFQQITKYLPGFLRDLLWLNPGSRRKFFRASAGRRFASDVAVVGLKSAWRAQADSSGGGVARLRDPPFPAVLSGERKIHGCGDKFSLRMLLPLFLVKLYRQIPRRSPGRPPYDPGAAS